MSWTKIKNIIIGILVLLNVFLLADIALTRHMSTALPKGTGQDFVNVLASHKITIEDELVPKYYESRTNIEVEFYDINALADIFVGEKANYTSDGEHVIASLNDKKLVVKGNRFEYSTLHKSVKKNGKDIIKALKNIGISSEGAVYDEATGLVKVMFDGAEIEGIYLDVTLSENGEIAHAEGVWPKITTKGTLDKVSVISSVVSIYKNVPEGAHIEGIEKVYVMEIEDKKPHIKIGWKIGTNMGEYIACK